MSVIVSSMPKTEQVRLPVQLTTDARMVASAFGDTLPEYVAKVLRQAVERDLPKAAKIVSQRAIKINEPEEDE